jgi:hypothetical protein
LEEKLAQLERSQAKERQTREDIQTTSAQFAVEMQALQKELQVAKEKARVHEMTIDRWGYMDNEGYIRFIFFSKEKERMAVQDKLKDYEQQLHKAQCNLREQKVGDLGCERSVYVLRMLVGAHG